MEPIQINPKSWHGRLAFHYNARVIPSDITDICTYTQYVLKGTVFAVLITILGGLFTGGFVDGILWAYFSYKSGMFLFLNGIGGMVWFFIMFGIVVIGGSSAWIYMEDYYHNVTQYKQPGFVTLAYRSLKDKYCAKVTFKGEKNG